MGLAWLALIGAGAVMGLAAVSSLTTRNIPLEEPTPVGVISEDIQSSAPSAVKAPSAEIVESLIPLPLSAGKTVYPGNGVSIQPVETRCNVERVLEWSKPGGQYCAITMAILGRGVGDIAINAADQAIYPLDPTLEGYRGSFFLGPDSIPRRTLTIGEAEKVKVVLIVDSPLGFTPAYALVQESALMPNSETPTQADTSS